MAIAATLSLMLLGAVSVSADRPSLLAGSEEVARLTIRADGVTDPSRVALTASMGKLSEVEKAADGSFTARFSPPTERYPQVALISACVEPADPCAFLALPVHGQDTLKLVTKPRANVTVRVGSETFGPHQADPRGRVGVRVIVPPGVNEGVVTSRDRFGNKKTREINLAPPPYPRVLFAAARTEASWADGAPLRLQLFAVDVKGAPLQERHLRVSADAGTVKLSTGEVPGVFVAEFLAPEQLTQPTARVVAAPAESRTDGASIELQLRPGPPAKLALTASAAEYVAGSGAPIQVQVVLEDAKGNAIAADDKLLRVFADVGRIEPGPAPHQRTFRVPDTFGDRTRLQLIARANALEARADIALRPAVASTVSVLPKVLSASAGGEPVQASVVVRDRFGNLVSGDAPAVRAEGFDAALSPRADGAFDLALRALVDAQPGMGEVGFARADGAVLGRAQVLVLPARSNWAYGGGVWLGGRTNLGRANGGTAALALHLRLGGTQFEAIGRAGYLGYQTLRAPAAGSLEVVTDLRAFELLSGLRYSVPLGAWWDANVSASAGGQRTFSTASLRDAASGIEKSAGPTSAAWSLALRFGVGAGWRIGPGRLMGEAALTRVPAQYPLSGALGGVDVGLGYVIDLR